MTLEVAAARFARPGGRVIFDGVGFRLKAGEVLCVLGPNGIGKTTLLRCLAGLDRLHGGTVRIDGQDIAHMPRRRAGQLVGLVPQGDAPSFSYTVREMVEMGRAPHLGWLSAPGAADRAIAAAALGRLGIGHLAARAYPELSGGERQMVLIARALAQQPKLLVLDEPTAHLDFANQAQVLDLVRDLTDQGLGIVLTTHDPDHAYRVGTSVLLMSHGAPARHGAVADVLTADNLSAAYRRPVALLHANGRTLCVT